MTGSQAVRIITRLNIGGPARQALILTRRLAEDFPTTLIAGRPPQHEGELADPRVGVVRAPLVRRIDPVNDIRAFSQVRTVLRESRPAIVHTHMAKAGVIGRLAAFSMRPRPRTVHTFHGHVLEGYFSPTKQRAFIAAERTVAKRTDVLVAVSTEIRDQLLDLGIGSPDQYRVIPLGLELDPFLAVQEPAGTLRRQLDLDPHVPLVGALGRLAAIKDYVTLVDAIAELSGVHLVILGDGEERPAIAQAAQRHGIGDRVHLPGWWADVAAAISDMDVVALSSRNEGTPVSLIEAQASGRPVVATDVGGVRSVVEDGTTGFVVPSGQPGALADRLAMLLSDRALRDTLGQQGREHVRSRFSADRLVRDIHDLYSDLTSPDSQSSH